MPARASPVRKPASLRSEGDLAAALAAIRACRCCALAHEPRPIVAASARSRILIVGQAPGRRAHESGISWNDPSGDRLRRWMGLDRAAFYDPDNVAIAAMGFCYPGTVNGADLPPRPECAPKWRPILSPLLAQVRLTLVVGGYAQKYYLGARIGRTLDETMSNWRGFLPDAFVLPHPSWRNTAWLKRNPWFETELTPLLRRRVADLLGSRSPRSR
jgi:uracil-DNA glycosylase